MLLASDSPEEMAFFKELFGEAIELVARPFSTDSFDFGDDAYFTELYAYGNRAQALPELRNSKAPRGSKDAIYMNRTYFGLYNMLNILQANIQTRTYMPKFG